MRFPLNFMRERRLQVRQLGRMDYAAALVAQKETERAVLAGDAPDTLLLVEHPHTFTIGRRGVNENILASREMLEERGVAVFETNRGGKITYHGPGQLVGYPIINLNPDRRDVHQYVRDLEETLIRALNDFRIPAFRIEGLTGVHTEQGKVAAIGVHIARWVTSHGFALNNTTDLSLFDFIIACEGEPVTSIERLAGRAPSLDELSERVVARFAEVFSMCLPQKQEALP